MPRVPVYSRHRRKPPPCYREGKRCEKRVVGCHSWCKDWKEWKEDDLKKKEEAYHLYRIEQTTEDYVVEKIREAKKKKGRG